MHADDRHGSAPRAELTTTSGWLEGSFDDDVAHGELGGFGRFTLVPTPGSSGDQGWVTLTVGDSDAIYGTYRVDGDELVTIDILGGTGRFVFAGGSLVGSKDVARPTWWLSGVLMGTRTTSAPPGHHRRARASEGRDPTDPTR